MAVARYRMICLVLRELSVGIRELFNTIREFSISNRELCNLITELNNSIKELSDWICCIRELFN